MSTAAVYILNLQYFFSVSRIRLDLKKIVSIVNNIKFVEQVSSRDGGMERSVANASNITRSKEFCPWPPKYLSKYHQKETIVLTRNINIQSNLPMRSPLLSIHLYLTVNFLYPAIENLI